jgi:hypothetical protein
MGVVGATAAPIRNKRSGQIHAAADLLLRRPPPTPDEWGWVSSRAGMDIVEGRLVLAGDRRRIPPLSSTYPSHYTDWAVPPFHYIVQCRYLLLTLIWITTDMKVYLSGRNCSFTISKIQIAHPFELFMTIRKELVFQFKTPPPPPVQYISPTIHIDLFKEIHLGIKSPK